VSALPILAMASLMAFGRVKRNRFFGFRTPATLSDDRIWSPANRFAGRALVAAVVSHILVLTLNLAGAVEWSVFAMIGWLLAAVFLAVAASMLRLRRIVKVIRSETLSSAAAGTPSGT
jgi:uncharacterized membrane protein